MPEAVIFDLDGVLLDSEQLWNEAKREVTDEAGGRWLDEAPHDMIGMSSPEWSAYMRDELGVPLATGEINCRVVERMRSMYERSLPVLPGAVETVGSLGSRWRLGLASSSNREIIDSFLRLSGLSGDFEVTVSSEEVERGKPSPDVYLDVAARLEANPSGCVAIEDSANGIRAAHAAGIPVIAVPNPHFPPGADALGLAAVAVDGVADVTVDLVEGVGAS